MILGIDTSAGQCAVALLGTDGSLLTRKAEPMDRGHAEALWPMIEAALVEAGAAYAGIRRIGVCTGPGSFTGIRVGVAAARGLGLGLGVPVVGIDRLRALAAQAGDGGETAVAVAGPRDTAYLRAAPQPGTAEARPVTQVPRAALDGLAPIGTLRLGDAWDGASKADGLADPATVARLARDRSDPAKPLYVRGPNADPPQETPPALLD